MQDRIYCSRCEQELDPEAFAPSQRKAGRYCRSCSAAYQADYAAGRTKRSLGEPRKDHLLRCQACGVAYTRWCNYKRPGSAGPRCHSCYLTYSRDRQRRLAVARKQRQEQRPSAALVPGVRPSEGNSAWRKRRAEVLNTETVCGICGGWVDKTLHHLNPKAASVDHIIPITWGGGHDRANLRLAHRQCNVDSGRVLPPVREVLLRAGLWIGERMDATL